ncbi:MAG: hypothetical protein EPO58_09925 [Chitinophagaceae bacterium]|nr:MAG: hypothetical protein EPO58_09925 [Chitinophagaceae bacterium]
MKKKLVPGFSGGIFIFILLVGFTKKTDHPNNHIDSPDRITDTATKSMLGFWRWVSGTDTLTILLKEEPKTAKKAKELFGKSLLVGWHRLVQKRNLVEGSFSFINGDTLSGNTTHASIRGFPKTNSQYIISEFRDLTGDLLLTGSLTLTHQDSNKALLELELYRDLRVVNRNHDYPNQFITIPMNIVMTRITHP